jgi:hypothetical protein
MTSSEEDLAWKNTNKGREVGGGRGNIKGKRREGFVELGEGRGG